MQFIISQVPDSISGGAGWIGAGLLGAVLSWLLLKHLPAKDAQLEKLLERHSNQIDMHRANCAKETEAQFDKFDLTLTRIMDRNSADIRGLITEMKSEFQSLAASLQDKK